MVVMGWGSGGGERGGGAEEVEQWESGVTQVILSVKPHKSAWFTFQVLRQSLLFFLVLMFILLIPPQAGYYSSEVHPILPYGQTIIFLMGRGEGGGQIWGMKFFSHLRVLLYFVLVGKSLWKDCLTSKKQDQNSGRQLLDFFFPWLFCPGMSFWKLPSLPPSPFSKT